MEFLGCKHPISVQLIRGKLLFVKVTLRTNIVPGMKLLTAYVTNTLNVRNNGGCSEGRDAFRFKSKIGVFLGSDKSRD